MRTATLFSYHLYGQRRRGGMHFICDSLRKAGWSVRFVTCDFSLITRLKGDRRTEFGRIEGVNRLYSVDESLSVGVVSTIWHPVSTGSGVVGRFISCATAWYPGPSARVVERFATGSDLVIVESCGALLMLDVIRRATRAPIIYRVSDNLRVVRPVPALLAAEEHALRTVDVVSLASEKLSGLLGVGSNLKLLPMGLDKARFDAAITCPYDDDRVKVVISGSSGLDCESLRIAAESQPNWDFVQFGAADGLPDLPNLIRMGERPFSEVVPYVKFAHVGFAPYLSRPGFEYQAEHSNRLLQYIYSGLPCVVPDALADARRPHFIGYRPGRRESIDSALSAAISFDRIRVPRNSVLDWDQVAAQLVASVGLGPDCEAAGEPMEELRGSAIPALSSVEESE